jgi:hypothetical protein
VENRKNLPAFDGNSVSTCFNFRENGLEFCTPKAKCLIPGGILGVFSR